MTGGAAWWNSTTAMARKATATWPLSWATRMPRKTNPTCNFLSRAATGKPPASRSREKNSKPWPTALPRRSSGGTERNATQTKIVMRSPYTMSHPACRLIGLLQLCLLPLIALASPPTPWKTDCVGRFNLELPEQVEVTMPFDVLYQHPDTTITGPSRGAVAFFGAGAGYHFPGAKQTTGVYDASEKDTQWVNTTIGTGPKVDAAGFAQHGEAFDQKVLKDKRYFLEKSSRKEIAATINLIETDLPNSRVWSQGGSYTYLLWRDGRLFSIKDWDEPDLRNEFVPYVAQHIRSREHFEPPKDQGLCLHSAFLPDNGNFPRRIAISYRLKDHPEVEITFSDGLDLGYQFDSDADYINDFWVKSHNWGAEQIRLLNPHVPGVVHFPHIKLGGHDGRRSLVELNYRNGKKDYGYLAFVMGDPNATEDKPNLQLFIKSRNMQATGQPLTREEFEALANRIAASIKRRY